jgi:tetratricopeptide (TPR) repeat protein
MVDDDRDPFEILLDTFTAAVRRGEAGQIDDWAKRHPEHAEQIHELFPTILALEGVRQGSSSGGRAGISVIDRLGDFRIVREIGRGGMGVVYEAEQESLGRRVAVKVLPPLRDPKRVHRFEREARTAARLHHTNIVPIFGVGEHDGWHYYVMQFIRGVGLDVVLRALRHAAPREGAEAAGLTPEDAVVMLRTGRFGVVPVSSSGSTAATNASGSAAGTGSSVERTPSSSVDARPSSTPGSSTGQADRDRAIADSHLRDPGPPRHPRDPYWRSVASLGRQVAQALAYAHGQGILHRDVKPANLLLDAQGGVWVTDFGLAKAVGHDGLTRSGDLVGTLQYMAPEQLQGRYDARTDVYGLGLTLYELMTLRPAFVDEDRGGLLKKIEKGDPTPPSQLGTGVPRDLETIVLKAVQHDPRHRYESAQAFADDLQRFLEDRPILARRATSAEQFIRWCRRNGAVASLGGGALLAVVGAAVTGWTGYVSTRGALSEARRQADRAGQNLDLALRAFEDVFDQVAGADRIGITVDESGDEAAYEWYTQPEVSGRDADLLERLLAFYERFAEQNAGSADLRQDTAKAYRRVGYILLQLGQVDEARSAYGRSLELLTSVGGDGENEAVVRAGVEIDLGRVEMEAGEDAAARAAFTGAIEALRDLDSRAARFELARGHELLGLLSFSRRRSPFARGGDAGPRPGGGDRGFPRGGPGREGDMPPRDRPPGPQGAPGREGLAAWTAARQHLEQAYELNAALAEASPDQAAFQLAAAKSGRYLALASLPNRGPLEVDGFAKSEIVRETLARLEKLAGDWPENPTYQTELARTYLEFAGRLTAFQRMRVRREFRGEPSARATEFVTRAVEIASQLHTTAPSVQAHARLLADALEEQAGVLPEATAVETRAALLRRALSIRPTTSSPDLLRATETRMRLARLFADEHQPEAALAEIDEVVGTLEALRAADPDFVDHRRRLADALRARARIAEEAGELDAAVTALLRSIELQQAEDSLQQRVLTIADVVDVARLEAQLGNPTAAMIRADRLLALIAENLPEGPDEGRGRGRLERFVRRPFEPLIRTLVDLGHEDRALELENRIRELLQR